VASVGDLTQWRDALLAARLNGMRRVRDANGEEIEYRSDAELARAIAAADALIAAASKPPITTIRFHTSKGL
jgi:hypothetical protein